VRNGDQVSIDIPARMITLAVSDAELAARRATWEAPGYERGYGWMFSRPSAPPARVAISIFWKRLSVRRFPNPTSIDCQGGEPWDARLF
jgi:hypothetical protein